METYLVILATLFAILASAIGILILEYLRILVRIQTGIITSDNTQTAYLHDIDNSLREFVERDSPPF